VTGNRSDGGRRRWGTGCSRWWPSPSSSCSWRGRA